MARPSRPVNRQVFTILALALAMFLIATNVQAGLLYIVSSGLLGLVAVSYVVPLWSVRALRTERRAPADVYENVPFAIATTVRNQGAWPRALVSINDGLAPGIGPAAVWVPGRGAIEVRYEAALPRGIYGRAPLTVSCAAPFGLWTAGRTAVAAAGLTVMPLFEDIATLPILEAMSSPAETVHERRGAGAGYDYLGIRDYRRGDSLRVVHWRSSARRGELVVKEFEEEISSPVTVVVCGAGTAGERGNTTLDAAARLAASIANYCLRSGHPLQLIGWDGAGLVSLDRPNLPQALEWLAGLYPAPGGTPERLAEETAVRVSPRSTVVFISPDVTADWAGIAAAVETRRVRLLAVLIDRASFGAGTARRVPAAEGPAGMLAATRATVYVYRKDESVRTCLSEPWRVTAR